MIKGNVKQILSIGLLLVWGLLGVSWGQEDAGSPVRVGLLQGEEEVTFKPQGNFLLIDEEGKRLLELRLGGRWQVQLMWGRPAEVVYLVVVESVGELARAQEVASYLKEEGYQPWIQKKGKKIWFKGLLIEDTTCYRVVLGPYWTQKEAEEEVQNLQGDVSPWVVPELETQPWGIMKFMGPGSSIMVEDMVRLVPQNPDRDRVTIYGIKVGKDFHWEHKEDRVYRGIMEFRIDPQGRITVINELPLEEYLRGVVPAEMSSGFPLEALKAQAVAARSRALFEMGQDKSLVPLDLSADVYSQVYAGVNVENLITDMAIELTRGEVLRYRGRTANAVYSAVCGGHTEDSSAIWNTSVPYLKPVFDADPVIDPPGPLDREETAYKWVTSSPWVYCNTQRRKVPPALEYTRKYFRWEMSYSQRELQRIIARKTGQEVGPILDLIPKKRGASGRIMELEVVGKRGRFTIRGELQIRKALSEDSLYSSCFVVQKEEGPRGIPLRFTLLGAGWGHGVGMCQTGAAIMALEGKDYRQILKHYFKGVILTRLY